MSHEYIIITKKGPALSINVTLFNSGDIAELKSVEYSQQATKFPNAEEAKKILLKIENGWPGTKGLLTIRPW